jgi:hypothetical protein
MEDGTFSAFIADCGVHARYVVAGPLLVVAESIWFPRLLKIIRHFVDSGLITPHGCGRFVNELRFANRLANSGLVNALVILCAYLAVAGLHQWFGPGKWPAWHATGDGLELSPPGIFHALISLPLLLILLLRWVWRQCVWCYLMFATSRLDLQVIAAHPDRAGGLSFAGGAVWGCWPIALAIGSITAGNLANQLQRGWGLLNAVYEIIGVAAVVLVMFVTPYVFFMPVLRRLKDEGVREYGALAAGLGRQFEAKWLRTPVDALPAGLEAPDFSATTDLFQTVSNVHQIRRFPLEFAAVRELMIVTLIPFLAIGLFIVPFDVILRMVGRLFI